MEKIIVPKNHIKRYNTYYNSLITNNNDVEINLDRAPTYMYDDGIIIISEIIIYDPSMLIPGPIPTTSNVNYRINLFDSDSDDDKVVRFIKLTLKSFPVYQNKDVLSHNAIINIYKKSDSTNEDCSITLPQDALSKLDVDGTYWLTFNTSTKKYEVAYPPDEDPSMIYKAIVPNKDNWMDFDNVTDCSTDVIGDQMTINVGDGCNQPYIGRMINIKSNSSASFIVKNGTTLNLTINTDDKILGIKYINLGPFTGPPREPPFAPVPSSATFNIYINTQSVPVSSNDYTFSGYNTGTVPKEEFIYIVDLYIDVKNNKLLTEDELNKAIDAF